MASAVVACCLRGTCIPAGVARFHVHHVCKFSLGTRCLSTAQGFNSNRTTLDCVPKRYMSKEKICPQDLKDVCKHNSSSVQQSTFKRFHETFSTDHILDEITSSSEASEVLNLTGIHRSRLTHVHVFQAFNHLWSLAKFYSNNSLEEFLKKLHEHPEFNALCVLAENKLSDADCKTLVDTLYSALRLTPEIYHPLVRALRTEIFHRLETLETDSLSKLAVCLQHMGDRCSPMLSEVLRLFYKKLHTVRSIRELSAWMREVIHLVASSQRQVIFQKVSQVLSETNPNEIGDNSIRRIIHSMVKVRSVNQPLLNQCAQILLQMIDSVSIKELCIMRNMLRNLSYENETLYEAINSTIIKKLPACQEPDELALAVECVSRSASADIKLMLTDKAGTAVPNLPPIAISHMCAGLRLMGYRSQTPLVLSLVKKIKQQSSNLSVDSVGTVLSFLKRIDNLEPEVFTVLQDRLLNLLRDTISPSRMINIVSSLAQLPSLESLDQTIPERICAFMPQIHIAGINQLLQATSKITRKLDDSESVRKDFLKLKQDLFEIAQVSIDKTMSIYYLNNLVEIILQDGGHVLVLDAAMKQYSKILHRLSPQLAVDCARNLFRARYLQRDLMDEIATMATRNINKITPMQILYILSPFCTLNYLPPNAPDFFKACIERCEPFLDSLPSGYLVDLTHILTFVHQFPETFIRRIFSLDFLTKLDEELAIIQDRSMMYRRKLMYLNRTVALECPELQVPWFHEQFCHDLLKKRYLTLDASLMSVQSALVEVLGGPQYLRSFVVSPYYYDISFECVLDSEGNPLACADYGSVLNRSGNKVAGKMLADLMQWGTQTKQLPHGAQRLAIDYMPSTLFCINSRHTLGMMALKKRHMELLGYRYVQIPHFVWSSPVLVEREEKIEYLRQLIFSPERTHQEGTVTDESNVGEILTGQVGPKLPRDLGIQEEGLLEDEMVLKVLHTFDRVG